MSPRKLVLAGLGLALLSGLSDAFAQGGALPSEGLAGPGLEAFDSFMRGFIRRHDLPGGAMAVAKDGRLVFARGYGYANRETGELYGPDSLTRFASCGKTIAAVAILQLVERGRLRLTDRLDDILPTTPPRATRVDPRYRDVTVLQLLTHTGGWDFTLRGDGLAPLFWMQTLQAFKRPVPVTFDAMLRANAAVPLNHDPGTEFHYWNLGSATLGKIVEARSGKSFEAFVREEILKPIGANRMELARIRAVDRYPREVTYASGSDVISFYPGEGSADVATAFPFVDLGISAGAGGWVGTVVDYCRFMACIEGVGGPRLLSADSVRRLVGRPEVGGWAPDARAWFAFCVEVPFGNADGTTQAWEKYGSLPGLAARTYRAPNGVHVAVAFNGRRPMPLPGENSATIGGDGFDAEIGAGIRRALAATPSFPAGINYFPRFDSNRVPEFRSPARLEAQAGRTARFRVKATRGARNFQLAGARIGLRIDRRTGLVRGVPRRAGTHVFVVSCENAVGRATTTLEVSVSDGQPVVLAGAALPRREPIASFTTSRFVDEVAMQSAALTVRASPGRTTRVIFGSGLSLAAAELSGRGELEVAMDSVSGSSLRQARKYRYGAPVMTGVPRLTLRNAAADSRVAVYPFAALNTPEALARNQRYPGRMRVRSVTVEGSEIGDLVLGNVLLTGNNGVVGIDAPATRFLKPVPILGLITTGDAEPVLRFGKVPEVDVMSGELGPASRRITRSGIDTLNTDEPGSDANGFLLFRVAPLSSLP